VEVVAVAWAEGRCDDGCGGLSLSLSPGEDRGLGREMEGCGLWLESG
jgi:hypothetical protein